MSATAPRKTFEMSDDTTRETIHRFEAAGLGKAPFRFVGFRVSLFQNGDGTVKAGSSCDYCAQSIANVYELQSSDGRRFHVGCDCIEKVGDAGLLRVVKATQAKLNRAKRDAKRARDMARVAAAEATMALPGVRAMLDAQPHPMGFSDRETGRALTLADWCDWMFKFAGVAGMLRAARVVEGTKAA